MFEKSNLKYFINISIIEWINKLLYIDIPCTRYCNLEKKTYLIIYWISVIKIIVIRNWWKRIIMMNNCRRVMWYQMWNRCYGRRRCWSRMMVRYRMHYRGWLGSRVMKVAISSRQWWIFLHF